VVCIDKLLRVVLLLAGYVVVSVFAVHEITEKVGSDMMPGMNVVQFVGWAEVEA